MTMIGATGCSMPARQSGEQSARPSAAASKSAGSLELQRSIASLEQRKTRLEDVNDIKRLQRPTATTSVPRAGTMSRTCSSTTGSIEIGLDGVYRGKQRVREYLCAFGNGKAGLAPGQLNEYLQIMPVITLSADGLSARGTWRAIVLAGQLGKDATWGEGPYENEYVKENGVWKLSRVHWYQTLMVPYEGGWTRHGDVNGTRFVGDRLEARCAAERALPVMAERVRAAVSFQGQAPGGETHSGGGGLGCSLATQLRRVAELSRDVNLLNDQLQIEILQQTYGYYLDKGLWTQAADLFAANGEIEVEGRGAHVRQGTCAAVPASHRPRRSGRRPPV